MSGYEFETMLELTYRMPNPPNMKVSGPNMMKGTRMMTPFLKAQSERWAASGGMFSVVLHAWLSSFKIEGTGRPLLEGVFANVTDDRVAQVLDKRMTNLRYDRESRLWIYAKEQQSAMVEHAERTNNQSITMFLVGRYELGKDEEQTRRVVGLMLKEMPRLHAVINNRLCSIYKKPERRVPIRGRGEEWKAQVRAASRIWLREYGFIS